ncbi:hypothetical protein HanOQP8_Chr03g0116571 [Helianthus annuus]|nr:hypothetical protein HanOQP8_Chr03g0116571 [Helianthus annuus]
MNIDTYKVSLSIYIHRNFLSLSTETPPPPDTHPPTHLTTTSTHPTQLSHDGNNGVFNLFHMSITNNSNQTSSNNPILSYHCLSRTICKEINTIEPLTIT